MLLMLSDMSVKLAAINEQIASIDTKNKALAKTDPDKQRLMEIPGIGPTIATALVSAIGVGSRFRKERDLAAWLGLVPRQITTGGKAKLIGISNRGNRYFLKLFIHGARTVLHLVRDRTSPLTAWVDGFKERAHVNVAAVAVTNNMARIASAVLTTGERYGSNALSGL